MDVTHEQIEVAVNEEYDALRGGGRPTEERLKLLSLAAIASGSAAIKTGTAGLLLISKALGALVCISFLIGYRAGKKNWTGVVDKGIDKQIDEAFNTWNWKE